MSYAAVNIDEKFGFGTMTLTNGKPPKTEEQAVETLKYITSNDKFSTKFINGGAHYGPEFINLKYLRAFLDTNTDEFNRELIYSIKGAFNMQTLSPDASEEGIRYSVENIASFFPSDPSKRPKILFEAARVDPKVPYPETVGYIAEYVKAGKIDGISLSEVGAATIAKASQIFPISCVELEFSIMCQDILSNGCVEECGKRGIPIVAYSPLCRGFLTDFCAENTDTWRDDIPATDIRLRFDTFSKENYVQNTKLIKSLYKYAHDIKGVSLECLALSWIISIANKKEFHGVKNLPNIIPIPSGSTKKRLESNLGSIIELSDSDLEDIDAIVKTNPVHGGRYNEAMKSLLFA